MHPVFLCTEALVLYFNYEPQLDPLGIKLPLPCEDGAWEAKTSEECARALGINGLDPQKHVNKSGSLHLKQIEMHLAVEALYSSATVFQPRTTNVFSRFILVHTLHIQIWQFSDRWPVAAQALIDRQLRKYFQEARFSPASSYDQSLARSSSGRPCGVKTCSLNTLLRWIRRLLPDSLDSAGMECISTGLPERSSRQIGLVTGSLEQIAGSNRSCQGYVKFVTLAKATLHGEGKSLEVLKILIIPAA
jgi:hypothetical protein